jgi:hypothetical protein
MRVGCKLAVSIFCAGVALEAQSLMPGTGPGGVVRILNTDSAVLEAQDVRHDLPCTVTPVKPLLGFDLRFHAGYEVSLPLREAAGKDGLLTTVFRVVPTDRKDDAAVYFSHRMTVPDIEEDAKGTAYLQGTFDLGEGNYHVDLLMRDRSERVCSFHWEVTAELPAKDKNLNLMIPSGAAEASEREPFKQEPPIEHSGAQQPLKVKVMVNFAPQKTYSATLEPLDTNALVSILRSISREPRIGKVSVVAFNVQQQRVVYRQQEADQIDFPALGEALRSLNLGTVDLKLLGQKRGETDFLTELITEEMGSGQHPDAVIFAGPKVMLEEAVAPETLRKLSDVTYPVFYMNYNLDPRVNPWRDAIGTAVKRLNGYEYTISRPRDLWYAWTEIMSRILRFHTRKQAQASSP